MNQLAPIIRDVARDLLADLRSRSVRIHYANGRLSVRLDPINYYRGSDNCRGENGAIDKGARTLNL